MKDKKMSIEDLVKWYDKNVNHPISIDFVIYLVTNKIIKTVELSLYSLNKFNAFMLEYKNGNLITDENGKYCVKSNRLPIINKFNNTQETKFKYKIAKLNGNHLKLIKVK